MKSLLKNGCIISGVGDKNNTSFFKKKLRQIVLLYIITLRTTIYKGCGLFVS